MLKNLILLSGFSTFAVTVIIVLNIYHDHQLSTLPPLTQTRVNKITSDFDKKTLDELKKRETIPVNLNEKSNVRSEDSEIVAPSDTDSGTASASAEPTPITQVVESIESL